MNVYLAGPLFTLAERRFNEELATALERRCSFLRIILPQRRALELTGVPNFVPEMFRFCIEAIERCDAVVAILDGPDADSGTCVEIGYARAKEKPIIGVRTDVRESEDRGLNLMVSNLCTRLILRPSMQGSIDDLAKEIAAGLDPEKQ